jgi:hypothetical protein
MRPIHFKKISGGMGLLLFLLSSFAFLSFTGTPQAPDTESSAWQQVVSTDKGQLTHVLLFSGPYFSWTVYETDGGAFQFTKGGSWKKDGKKMEVMYEFHSAKPEQVGTSETWTVKQKKKKLTLRGAELEGAWSSLDKGVDSPLDGPWIFSGRKRDGEIQRVDMTTRPRKTMKILTENRFQWIAYNTETGDFHGTGGGNYTATDGVYTENIEFFSRDNSRVGASLEFQFEVMEGDWHHSGKNSRGEPLYEIWSKRK